MLRSRLGPCSLNAVELDGDSMQALSLRLACRSPDSFVLSRAPDAEQSINLAGSLAVRAQNILEQDSDASSQNDEVVAESVTSLDLGVDAVDQAPYGTGFTPENQSSANELRKRQLVWGRFAEGKAT